MKRLAKAVLSLAVPAFLLLNAWQGYRYHEVAQQVAELEQRQKELLESNRDIIGQIAAEGSADRVAGRATGELGLRPADPSRVTRIVVGQDGEGSGQ
jgi:cell division protein FtsL